MMKIELPFWMSRNELKKLKDAAQKFWQLVEVTLRLPLTKFDVMTCDLILVDKVAYERKIERLEGEDELIYRKRVDFAFVNAQDAGMTQGMYNIFDRLGLTVYDIKERQPGKDWDIIMFELDDATLANNKELLNLLVRTYGATCRRYEYSVTDKITQNVHHGEMTWSHHSHIAKFPPVAPSVVIDAAAGTIELNEVIRLTATVEGTDPMDIIWTAHYHDGVIDVIGQGPIIDFSSSLSAVYEIHCTATNEAGSDDKNISLTVLGPEWNDYDLLVGTTTNTSGYKYYGFGLTGLVCGDLNPRFINDYRLNYKNNIVRLLMNRRYIGGRFRSYLYMVIEQMVYSSRDRVFLNIKYDGDNIIRFILQTASDGDGSISGETELFEPFYDYLLESEGENVDIQIKIESFD